MRVHEGIEMEFLTTQLKQFSIAFLRPWLGCAVCSIQNIERVDLKRKRNGG